MKGWSDRHVDEHEKGHRNVARALGYRAVTRGGATYVDDRQATPTERAAIAYGGRARAGHGGHEGDNRIAEAALRELPWSQRGAARREAQRIARRHA